MSKALTVGKTVVCTGKWQVTSLTEAEKCFGNGGICEKESQ